MSITLSPKVEALVEQMQKSGQYATPDALIRAALEHLASYTDEEIIALKAKLRLEGQP